VLCDGRLVSAVAQPCNNLPGWFPGVGAAIDLATFDPFPQVAGNRRMNQIVQWTCALNATW
jgi:hypothetical protein